MVTNLVIKLRNCAYHKIKFDFSLFVLNETLAYAKPNHSLSQNGE